MNRLEQAKLAAIQTEEELQDIIDLANKCTWSITIYDAMGLGRESSFDPLVINPGDFIHEDEDGSFRALYPAGTDMTAVHHFTAGRSLKDRNIGANYNENYFFRTKEDATEFVEACKDDTAHCAKRAQFLEECRAWDRYFHYDDNYDFADDAAYDN